MLNFWIGRNITYLNLFLDQRRQNNTTIQVFANSTNKPTSETSGRALTTANYHVKPTSASGMYRGFFTPLETAIARNDVKAVKFLICDGADPEEKGEAWRARPLFLCIPTNKMEIVKYLVEMGINTTRAYRGLTPLSSAILHGRLEMAKLFLDNGADLTICEGLVAAIYANNVQIVQELITRGADVNRPNGKSKYTIMCALHPTRIEILKLLIANGADVNTVDGNGDNPLMQPEVYKNRHCYILKFLIENGADVNWRNHQGDTPLMKCVQIGNLPMAEELIRRNVDVNVRNAKNETALSLAVSNFDFRTFKFLIASGADLELARDAIDEVALRNQDLYVYVSTVKRTAKLPGPIERFTGQEASVASMSCL